MTGTRLRMLGCADHGGVSGRNLRTERAPLVVIDGATELKATPEALVTALLGRS